MTHPIEKYMKYESFVEAVYGLLYNALIVRGSYSTWKRDEQQKEKNLEIIQRYADAILKWAGEPEGKYKLPYLGEGADAEVFWLNNDKKYVLKLTMDQDDARAAYLIHQKPDKALLKIKKVVDVCHGGHDWGYAILSEKLTPLDNTTGYHWAQANNALAINGLRPLDHGGMTWKWLDKVVNFVNKYLKSEDREKKAYATFIDRILPTLQLWVKALQKKGILWSDFHLQNVMLRRHQPVIVDFGRATVYGGGSIPKLQVSLPEKP